MKNRNILYICLLGLVVGFSAKGQTFDSGWHLSVSLIPDQPRVLELMEDEPFHIGVKVQLNEDRPFTQFETRPRLLSYFLFENFDGISYEEIKDGELLATVRVPAFQEKTFESGKLGVIFQDGPTLYAPSDEGVYFVAARIPPNGGGGALNKKLGHTEQVICSDPVKLIVRERPRPDLVVREFTVKSAVKTLGDQSPDNTISLNPKIILRAEVANVGNADAKHGTRIGFYRILRDVNFVNPQMDQQIEESQADLSIPPLEEGESIVKTLVIDNPGVIGRHEFGAYVEPIRGFFDRESDLTNNGSRTIPIFIQKKPGPQADLVIDSVRVSPDSVPPGDTVSVIVEVRNRGSRTVEEAFVTVNLPNSNEQAVLTIDDLEPEATETLYTSVIVPESIGLHTSRVCVATKTPESDKDNNCAQYEISVN